MRQHFHHGHDGLRQDRRPGAGHAQEPLVRQVGDWDAGIHGARNVRGTLRRRRRRLRIWHVHAGDGHQRVSLLGVHRTGSDLQESHQRTSRHLICISLNFPKKK